MAGWLPNERKDDLTPSGVTVARAQRELEVLKLICDGGSIKGVAAGLFMSFKTATCRRSRLPRKVGSGWPMHLGFRCRIFVRFDTSKGR